MRRILTLALLLSLSTAARAAVVWQGDFETGDLSQWSHPEAIASRLTVVPSPVRQGKYALRTEVRQGDVVSGGTRNELDWVDQPLGSEGMDLYYSWSTMFDAGYPSVTGFQVFTQWHQIQLTGGAPPLELNVLVDQIQLGNNINNVNKVLWSTPLVRGVWHDFIVHVKWSSNPGVGFVELWYDGEKVLNKTPCQTLLPSSWVYLKQGLYRDSSIVPAAVLYHDGTTVATALEDVLPPPPDPVTPPAPSVDGGTPPPDTGTPPPGAGTPPTSTTSSAPDAGTPDAPAAPAQVSTPVQTASAFPSGGCTSAPADLVALGGIAAFLLGRRRKRS